MEPACGPMAQGHWEGQSGWTDPGGPSFGQGTKGKEVKRWSPCMETASQTLSRKSYIERYSFRGMGVQRKLLAVAADV